MDLRLLVWSVLVLLSLMLSCGNDENKSHMAGDSVSHEVQLTELAFEKTATGDSDWRMHNPEARYTRHAPSNYYKKLVQRGHYQLALDYVCQRYKLNCRGVSIGRGFYSDTLAETNALTNHVTITQKAFYRSGCHNDRVLQSDEAERFRCADDRFLALIVQHELFHKYHQSRMARFYASRLSLVGSPLADYYLELDAWNYTKMQLLALGLTLKEYSDSTIIIFVTSQVRYYQELIDGLNSQKTKGVHSH